MGCFCQASMTTLAQRIAALAPPDGGSLTLDASLAGAAPGADLVAALAAWLAARALPAAPWQPDPAWLELRLPMPRLDAAAVATISALVQLRTQVLAQFGLDLLLPAQAAGFARIVATLNARLAATALGAIDLAAWTALARRNDAIDQVRLALRAGLFAPAPDLLRALAAPGGRPIGQWAGLLAPLRRLAPLIAAAMQLGVTVTETAPLAEALRVLARVSLPALAAADVMASLGAGLAAVARLQASLAASLGADPLRAGFAAVAALVQRKQAALAVELTASFGADLMADSARLLVALPNLPVVPSSLATADVVRLAVTATPLALVQWQVPDLPAARIGLAVCAFTAQIQAAFGIDAVLRAPCGGGCDAASLLRAIGPG